MMRRQGTGHTSARPGRLQDTWTLLTFEMHRFVMASRDAATGTRAARLNPLNLTTPEEKMLFALGDKSIALRAKKHGDTLFEHPPTGEENRLIHKMFLSTIDHKARTFSARKKPDNSEWMTDSKLKSVLLCEPKHRNYYNLVFGGLIMEKCMDLALTNTYNYTGCEAAPKCTHVDDVLFLRPVEIGDLLFFHSQVVMQKFKYSQVLYSMSRSCSLTRTRSRRE